MRGFRIVVGSLLLAAIAAASLLLFWRGERTGLHAPTSARIATDAELGQMLLALLDHRPDLFPGRPLPPPKRGDPPRRERPASPLVVSDKTLALCLGGGYGVADDTCDPTGTLYAPMSSAMLEKVPGWPDKFTLDGLLVANRHAGNVELPRHVRIVPDTDGDAGRRLSEGGWPAFYARYPEAAGRLAVSRGVIEPDGLHGWMYAATSCEGTCGKGYLLSLSTVAHGRWQVDRAFIVWMS